MQQARLSLAVGPQSKWIRISGDSGAAAKGEEEAIRWPEKDLAGGRGRGRGGGGKRASGKIKFIQSALAQPFSSLPFWLGAFSLRRHSSRLGSGQELPAGA